MEELKKVHKNNAEHQRRYREKKGINNNTSIKRDELQLFINDKNEFERLPPIKEIFNSDNNPIFSTTTKKIYINTIKRISTPNEEQGLNEIINMIEGKYYNNDIINSSYNYIKLNPYEFIKDNIKYIKNIHSIFAHINGFEEFIKISYNYMKRLNENNEYIRRNRTPMNDDKDDNNLSFVIDDIMRKLDNYKLKPIDKLFIGLFTLVDVKRPNDYRIMKIININPLENDEIDKQFNYYYKGNIYIFQQKIKTIELNIIELNKEIKYIIDDFIINNNLKNDDYILGKLYSPSEMTFATKEAFFKAYNKAFTPTEIRREYATYLDSLKLDYKQRLNKSLNMGHGIKQNCQYSYR
jgi:hypothetical protein